MARTCKVCNEDKELDDFYKHGPSYERTCKICVLKAKKIGSGPSRLAPDVLEKLTADLAVLKPRIADIGPKYGIKPATLYYWIRTGKLKKGLIQEEEAD